MARSNKPRQPQRQPVESTLLRRPVEAGTAGQVKYVRAIRESDITVVNGLAGTGKTFLAAGLGVHALLSGDKGNHIRRIIITRPTVTAGEELGFLPGGVPEKIDPFTAPIFEAIRKFCKDQAEYEKLVDPKGGLVEIVPIAFMRGRTFDNAFVILDEAQNTTPEQMFMFLTRMGKHCKVVITGDVTQSDLDDELGDKFNGLELCLERLPRGKFTKGKVSTCHLGIEDIMRNDLIAEVIIALNAHTEEDDEDDQEDGEPEDGGPYDGHKTNGNGFYPHHRFKHFGPPDGPPNGRH